jgi:2,3-dihydroxybiphenyl 1,2-dioxygenase
MAIVSLAYLGVRTADAKAWASFATDRLGMQSVDRGGGFAAYRMDDRLQRLMVCQEDGNALAFMGWQVSDAADLDYLAARVEALGIRVTAGSRSICDQRGVDNLVYFIDADGNQVELVYRPHCTDDPFIPGRPISGFTTGAYGMGHAVLNVRDVATLLPLYRDALGFNVSDYGLTPYPMYFFHVNGRHHSFAMIGSGATGLHHFMVEYNNLDDVGQGYDLAQQDEDKIAYTLGRHTNDYMTSFYSHTPSGFFVESGWGGRIIDPVAWQPHETTCGPSFWGHERLYLSETDRARMRDMRLDAAANGLQAPAFVDCPWLYQQKSSNPQMD